MGTNGAIGCTIQEDPLVVVDTETRLVVVNLALAFATSEQVPGAVQVMSSIAPSEGGTFVDSHLDPPSTVHNTPLPVSPSPATAHRIDETQEMDGRPGPMDDKPSRRTENEALKSVVLRIVVPGTPEGPPSPTVAKQVDTEGQARPFWPAVA